MVERKELRVGDRYDYRDKGMTEPVRVVIERIDDDEVFTQLEKEKFGRRWQIDTFVENATVVLRLGLQFGG
jgi:hypothetical protein